MVVNLKCIIAERYASSLKRRIDWLKALQAATRGKGPPPS